MSTSASPRAPFRLKPLCSGLMFWGGAALLMTGCSHAPTQSARLGVKPAYQVTDGGRVDRSYGYIARAREFEQDQLWADALIWWRKAVEVAPTRADAHQGLGLCLARQDRLEDAVSELRTAQNLKPNDPVILNNLGYALKLMGQAKEAEARQLFERALEVNPGYDRARYNLAQLSGADMSLRVSPAQSVKAETAMPATQPRMMVVQSTPNVPSLSVLSSPSRPVDVAGVERKPSDEQVADAHLSLTPSVTLSGVAVEVFNGNGLAGAARKVRDTLVTQGVTAHRLANIRGFNVEMTRVVYAPGHAAEARKLATMLTVSAELVQATPQDVRSMRADLRVVLGQNFRDARLAAAVPVDRS